MTISVLRVTQIAVFEEFNLFLVIADKSLIAYHLDAVCPASGVTTQATVNDSARKAPQKLSGSHQIGFFAAGRMKDRTLIMYKKRDGMSSTFKVCLELVSIPTYHSNLYRSSNRCFRNPHQAATVSSTCAADRPNSSANMTSSTSPQKATGSTCSTHHLLFRLSVV